MAQSERTLQVQNDAALFACPLCPLQILVVWASHFLLLSTARDVTDLPASAKVCWTSC